MLQSLLTVAAVELSSNRARKDRAARHAAFDARFNEPLFDKEKLKADSDAFFARARARSAND
jgi:hypothetical protein